MKLNDIVCKQIRGCRSGTCTNDSHIMSRGRSCQGERCISSYEHQKRVRTSKKLYNFFQNVLFVEGRKDEERKKGCGSLGEP